MISTHNRSGWRHGPHSGGGLISAVLVVAHGCSAKTAAGYAVFLAQKARHGASPSFYLYTAQEFRKHGASAQVCLKIVTNVLEVSLCNAQTCRVVAYHLHTRHKYPDRNP
jgi:hypothetical protein